MASSRKPKTAASLDHSPAPSRVSVSGALLSLLHPYSAGPHAGAGRRAHDGTPPAADQASRRLPLFDVLRGVAIVAMIAYHFAFDLNFFGVFEADFYLDERLIAIRNAIVTVFLLLVGISLTLAFRNGVQWRRYATRLVMLGLSALVVSIGSALLFPQSWIFFGVLHFIFAASVLALAFKRWYRLNLLFGIVSIIVGLSFSHPAFDSSSLNWIGLTTAKPVTEDYVPLLPWFGVVMIGMFLGRLGLRRIDFAILAERQPVTRLSHGLAWSGRHSLAIYLLHQPVLLGLIWVVLQLLRT